MRHPVQDEVLLEFHVDDTAADDKEDTLVEMAFHVPAGNEQWGAAAQTAGAEGEEPVDTVPAAKVCVGFGVGVGAGGLGAHRNKETQCWKRHPGCMGMCVCACSQQSLPRSG